MKKKNKSAILELATNGLHDAAKVISKKATNLGDKIMPFDIGTLQNLDLKNFGKAGKKIKRLIKKNPAKAMLLAVGFGYALSKSSDIKEAAEEFLTRQGDRDQRGDEEFPRERERATRERSTRERAA